MAEGVRLVEEAIAAGVEVRGVVVSPALEGTERGVELVRRLNDHAIPVLRLADRELEQLADTESPQGVVAVVRHPSWALADLRPARREPVVVLDALQDPRNAGAVLRTAYALGAAGAVALPGTVALTHPKLLRGAMGATFRLPAVRVQPDALAPWLVREEITLWIADARGTPVARLEVPDRLALVVGNEGAGVRRGLEQLSSTRVAVPLTRGAESLNVAVAAGILLYEVISG